MSTTTLQNDTRSKAAPNQMLADRFGQRFAAVLNQSDVDHAIVERLKVARLAALAKRRKEPALVPVLQTQMAHAGGLNPASPSGFSASTALAWLIPLLALVAGVYFSEKTGFEKSLPTHRAERIASIDAAVLGDPLPPSAYADPAFMEYMRRQLAAKHAQ